MRWYSQLPVLVAALILGLLCLRDEPTAAARDRSPLRLPRNQRVLLEGLRAELSKAAEPAEPADLVDPATPQPGPVLARVERLAERGGDLLPAIQLLSADGRILASSGPRPDPLQAGLTGFDRALRDQRPWQGPARYDQSLRAWTLTLTHPIAVPQPGSPQLLLRTEVSLAALAAHARR